MAVPHAAVSHGYITYSVAGALTQVCQHIHYDFNVGTQARPRLCCRDFAGAEYAPDEDERVQKLIDSL